MSAQRLCIALLAAAMLAVSAATPALADYGFANWQTAFAGTGVAAGTGQAFGFWGWCAFAGGVTSGNSGECQFAQYVHASGGAGFTCHEEVDVTSWNIAFSPQLGVNTFHISGTARVTPSSATAPCLVLFPGPGLSTFTGIDSGIPAVAGHYNLGGLGPGLRGEFQIQVTQVR